ncbi:NAD-dependent epimerase/dehydratase family protein [Bernardetia sp.]|uniref:NAD-dependent epimerase/dehydratase family protein n=1 Tax=Bernardetia sp. TaxID=1937974 RepID=UPI0025B7DBAD|nr:NAD-dependent epimerase/dehydratase family protein [Bernardetia sp.]
MNYFITGATGFLGSYLVEELISENQDKDIKIVALKRKNSKISTKLQDYPTSILEWVDGDLLDVVFLDEIMKNIDRVIHGAAIVSFDPRDKNKMHVTNVEGTKNMINAALASDVKLFCQISSVAALGQPLASQQSQNIKIEANGKINEITFIDEKARWTPEYTGFSAYAFTKHLSELEVWRGQAEGLDVVIVNPSFILGYDENGRSSTALIEYIKSEKAYYGGGFSNFVDVRDVAEMTVSLLDKSELHNERYILNGGTVPYSELMPKIAKALNKKPPHKPVPNWVKKYGWRLAKAWSFVSGSSPIITKDSLEAADRTVTHSNQKIKVKLDVEFRMLDETVEWIGESYR